MTAGEILETGARNIVVATGADWRRDGIGRTLWRPVEGHDLPNVFTPDDLMENKLPSGRVVIFDDDHYYIGGVLAELLASGGATVTIVTPAPLISYWSQFTLEQERVQRKLMKIGVRIYVQQVLNLIRAQLGHDIFNPHRRTPRTRQRRRGIGNGSPAERCAVLRASACTGWRGAPLAAAHW